MAGTAAARMQELLADVLPLPVSQTREAKADVVVCGAGPTGLLLACSLQLLGVDVLVVDPHPTTSRYSKAMVVMPRSMEVLDQVGCAAQISKIGRPVTGVRVGFPWAWQGTASGFGKVEMRCRFGAVLVGQNVVEHVLYTRYKALGGRVLRGARITDLDQGKQGVSVHVERYLYDREIKLPVPEALQSQDNTTLSCRYLVGADGRRSKVRQKLKVKYEGEAYPQRFWLADFTMTLEEEQRCGFDKYPMQVVQGNGESLLFVAGEFRRWRMVYVMSRDLEEEPTEELLRAKIQSLSPEPRPRPDQFQWVTSFQVTCSMVAKYRHRHCFLAGDAAHCHSPAGGQGMNTGLQDAANLAWKLAAWLKNLASDLTLESYSEERVPVAKWVLQNTDRLFRGFVSASATEFALRRALIWLVCATVPGDMLPPPAFKTRLHGLSVDYRGSPVVRNVGATPPEGALQAGDRLPDLRVVMRSGQATTLLEQLRPVSLVYRVFMVGWLVNPEETHAVVGAFANGLNAPTELFIYDGGAPTARPTGGCWQGALRMICGAADKSQALLASLGEPRDPGPAATLLRRDGKLAGCEATLSQLLKLQDGEVAMLVVRPDGHIAVSGRGSPLDIESTITAVACCGVL